MTIVPLRPPLFRAPSPHADGAMVSRRTSSYGDFYLLLLAIALLGYATLGKTFAYSGIPPIFVGEILLLLGIFAFINANCVAASLSTFPSVCLIALMGWAIVRTVPYIHLYGLDALRDSVTLLYGTLALIITAILLQDAGRLNRLVQYYGRFALLVPPAMTVIAVIALAGQNVLPKHPSTGLPIFALRSGDLGAHLGGISVFVLLGFCRPGRFWSLFLAAIMIVVATQNRGALLAMIVPLTLAAIVSGKIRRVLPIAIAVVFCVSLAYVADAKLPLTAANGDRDISARQLVDNAFSIFSSSKSDLDGTKKWRLAWWQTIKDYTLFGDYFWTGKGFGVNLAESDGFVVGRENADTPVLRSPHNVHLTILARTGVPGLVLWLTTLTAWAGMLTSAMIAARMNGDRRWSDFFLFLQCYLLAILITSSFDIALEGPILGFWFWSLFGVGIGSVMIYRARPLIVIGTSSLCSSEFSRPA